MGREVIIPYAPRPLQAAIHPQLEAHRFSVAVCHRRFGKTVLVVNHLLKHALTCRKPRPRFAYLAPTFRQGKAVAWDYMKHYAQPVPGQTPNESELRIDFPHNDGQIRIYGSDNPDSLRGIYLDGVVLDEYGLMPATIFGEVIRPALSDRGGWALFIGTPNGKNQFWDIAQQAQSEPGWFFAEYKASETGILSPDELASARTMMTADEYAQEYECSFEASVKGSIYGGELETCRAAGRTCAVPVDPILPVDTDWDLGVGDSTAIWFSQSLRSGEIRLVDYHESSGEGLPHYAQVLASKGYTYGTHWAPHDIEVRELGSGRSRIEVAASLGIKFRVVPNIPLEDGIHAARMLFPRCWFDRVKCQKGLDALSGYRRDYNTRLNEFKAVPVHDWAEHGASAFRYLAVRHRTPKEQRTPLFRPPSARDWLSV